MPEILWPPQAPIYPIRNSVRGGGVPDRVSFQTDSNIPIDRPLITAQVKNYDITLPPMARADFAAFEDWYRTTLGMGTRRFVWLHPMTGRFALCRILSGDPAYQEQQVIKQKIAVSFRMMVLPNAVDQQLYLINASSVMVAL